MTTTPLDDLADELGAISGRIERDTRLRLDAAIADLRRIDAERELRLVNLERMVADRLASVKDGEPGRSVTVEDVALVIAAEVARQVAALPPAEPGASVTVEDVRPLLAEMVAALRPLLKEMVDAIELPRGEPGPRGERGPEGRLSVARAWSDRVHYEGEIVTHDGATFQAQRDTGRAPPHDDWICLAGRGQDGRDGKSPRVRDTFDATVTDYRELDIVALNGASFIARRDDPGPCPGDGWKMIAMQGKTGRPGERGAQGPRGPAGPAVVALHVDDQGLLTLSNGDASKVELDLYPLLSRLQA